MMSKLCISVFIFVLILSGCSRMDTPPEKFRPIVIGLIPEQNVFKQVERYKPLAEYIHKKTGIKNTTVYFASLRQYY